MNARVGYSIILALFLSGLSVRVNGQTGENCGEAINLGNLESPITGSTAGRQDDFDDTCLGSGAPDLVFYIDVPAGHTLLMAQLSNSYDSRHRLAYGGSCPGTTDIECRDDPDTQSALWVNNTEELQRVWWIQDGYFSGSGTFTLAWEIYSPPANDDCPGAVSFPPIPANGDCVTAAVNTISATSSLPGCSGGDADDDVWFSFSAPGETVITQITPIDGADVLAHEVYSGACGSLTSILCSDFHSNVVTGLTPGQVYFIRVYSWISAWPARAELCLRRPSANDLCEDAIPVGCGQTLSGSTLFASVDDVPSCGTSLNTANGVWFRFTGTGAEATASLCSGADYDTKIGVFTGNCGALDCVTGDDDYDLCGLLSQVAFNTQPGEQYFILVTGYQSNTGNFELSIDCGQIAGNDLAATAILSPSSGCTLNPVQPVTVEISNEGLNPQSSFQVGYRVNGGPAVIENANQSMAPGTAYTHTFATPAAFPSLGDYTVTAFTLLPGDGIPSNDTLSTIVSNLPPFDAANNGDQDRCPEDGYTVLTAQGGTSYSWSTGSTTYYTYVFPNVTTSYTVTVTNALGCVDVDTITVEVHPLAPQPAIQYSSLALCPGGTVTLTSSITENIQWSTGATTPAITVSQPGYYYVAHFSEEGCSRYSASLYIGQSLTPLLDNSRPSGICEGESATLRVFGGQSYAWENGSTGSFITVQPAATTTYAVTVTNSDNCVFELSAEVVVLPDAPPGPVGNLLPPDGTQNVPLPVTLSWGAAGGAGLYEVYIWPQGGVQPSTPNYQVNSLSVTIHQGLQNGQAYNWRVRPRSCQEGQFSAVQKFTVAYQPDLVVYSGSVETPATAFSGTEVEVLWQVWNQGQAATPPGAEWYDYLYLSDDQELSPDDRYLGSARRPSSLNPSQLYNSSKAFTLPPCLEGDYYVIVVADGSNYVAEANNGNNTRAGSTPISVALSPRADLRVTAIVPPGVAGILQEGQSYTIIWEVANQGTDTTACGGWLDRVFINRLPFDNPQTRISIGNLARNISLAPGASYRDTLNFTLPGNLVDTVYFYVLTDITDCEEECLFEENNRLRTDPIRIVANPRPDFLAALSGTPPTASNRQPVAINWSCRNEGIPYSGPLRFSLYLRQAPDVDISSPGSSFHSFTVIGQYNTGAIISGTESIAIPNNVNGDFYLLLVANPLNTVDELANYDAGNADAEPLRILSPNLQVGSAAAGASTMPAGSTTQVEWAVHNEGPGALINTNVSDCIELASSPQGPAIYSISVPGALAIAADGSVGRQRSFTLPADITPGDYFLRIWTNCYQTAYEAGLYGDNTFLIPIEITAPVLSNLTIEDITPPPGPVFAGAGANVIYTGRNGGPGATSGNWQDRIYLSASPTYNPLASTLVASRNVARVLSAGEAYRENVSMNVPGSLAEGVYYACVVSDAQNNIYESEEADNALCGGPFLVQQPEVNVDVDLALENIIAPSNLEPGQIAFLSWRTRNLGSTATAATGWEDRLYLSSDQAPNPSQDQLIATWPRFGALGAGAYYSRNQSFTIPAGQEGAFYLILVTDAGAQAQDGNRSNNEAVLSLNSGNDPVVVVVGPRPDLVVSLSDELPDVAVAGQPLKVPYTVTNNGPGTVPAQGRSNAVVLALNEQLDNTPVLLGQQLDANPLNVGGPYKDTLAVTVPGSAEGNYFLGIFADAGNNLQEANESNNKDAAYLLVFRPPPCDLQVRQVSTVPAAASGSLVDISWQVANTGQNPAQGYMEQGLYLSFDTAWDASDVFLGAWQGTFELGVNGTLTHRLEACITGVPEGDYYVVVRTDLLNNIIETDDGNNTGSSIVALSVTIPELEIDIPESTVLSLEKEVYYRLEVDDALAGETIKVSLSSEDDTAINELYVRYSNIPNRTVFDYGYEAPFEADQSIILPDVTEGTYYIMAYNVFGEPAQQVELLAEIIPFELTRITANVGGNTGNVTVEVRGTRFAPGMQLRLEGVFPNPIEAINVEVASPVRAFATFALLGAPLGVYDVAAVSAGGDAESTLVRGFTVATGTLPGASLSLSCSADGNTSPFISLGEDDLGAGDPLELEKIHPATARPNRLVTITLRYVNNGNIDVGAPQLMISSLGGAPLSADPSDFEEELLEIDVEFQEDDGPPDILRPGGVATYTLYTRAVSELRFRLF